MAVRMGVMVLRELAAISCKACWAQVTWLNQRDDVRHVPVTVH